MAISRRRLAVAALTLLVVAWQQPSLTRQQPSLTWQKSERLLQRKTITEEEAVKRLTDTGVLENVNIDSALVATDLDLRKKWPEGGFLEQRPWLKNIKVSGYIDLSGLKAARFNLLDVETGALLLDNLEVAELSLSDVAISKNGRLSLCDLPEDVGLEISFRKPPRLIFVNSREAAELVHWAAPNVPIKLSRR